MDALSLTPYQGTLQSELKPGLRHVTKNQTAFYFDIDDAAKTIRIVAVFFGGQNHNRHTQARLAGS